MTENSQTMNHVIDEFRAFFGIQDMPFSLVPNTRYYVALPSHNECFSMLLFAIAAGDGFSKVTGEVGTGKTLLCRRLLNSLNEKTHYSAYIPNPRLSPVELKRAVAKELQVKDLGWVSDQNLLDEINKRLIDLAKQGKKVVLVIDEAQALPENSLEELRLLTNLETHSDKLLQIILLGQPELNARLAKYELRQLNQRFSARYHLQPLNFKQVRQYVEYRLQVAGQSDSLFSWAALYEVHRLSGGIPRLINLLAGRCLMGCYSQNKKMVGVFTVKQAAKEVLPVPQKSAGGFKRSMGLAFLFCAVLLAGLLLERHYFNHAVNTLNVNNNQDISLLKHVENIGAGMFKTEVPPIIYEPLSQGDQHAIIPFVRQYLSEGLQAQLQNNETWAVIHPDVSIIKNDKIYDTLLMESVKSFQSNHGLLVDGVLGRRTLLKMDLWDQFLLGGL